MNLQEQIKKEYDAADDKLQFLNEIRKYISSLSPEKIFSHAVFSESIAGFS